MKLKKAKDLNEGDELIRYKHRGWVVDKITINDGYVDLKLKYGSSTYLGLRLDENDEVKVIAKEEKE